MVLNMNCRIPGPLLKAFLRAIKDANDGMNFQLRVEHRTMVLFQGHAAQDNVETWRQLGKPRVDYIEIEVPYPNLAQPGLVKSLLPLFATKILVPYLTDARTFQMGVGHLMRTQLADDSFVVDFVPVEKYVKNEGQKMLMDSDGAARSARPHFTNKQHVFPPGVAGRIQSFLGTELPASVYHKYSPVRETLREDWESVREERETAAERQEAARRPRGMREGSAAAAAAAPDMAGDDGEEMWAGAAAAERPDMGRWARSRSKSRSRLRSRSTRRPRD